MSYSAQRAHVDAAEKQFLAQLQRSRNAWHELHDTAQRGITPPRIVVAGLLGGFLLGYSDLLERVVRGTRFVNLISSLIAFASSLQAQLAAAHVDQAAEHVDAAAQQVDAAAETTQAASETVAEAAREVA